MGVGIDKFSCWDIEHYNINTTEVTMNTLRWRHNDHAGVSNHQPHGCLLNRLFGRRWKRTSKLHVTGLCAGNSPGPVNSPHKWPVTRKMFPFDDVIMNEYIWIVPCTWVLNNRELWMITLFWLIWQLEIQFYIPLIKKTLWGLGSEMVTNWETGVGAYLALSLKYTWRKLLVIQFWPSYREEMRYVDHA